MAYLTESQVRKAAADSYSHRVLAKSFTNILKEESTTETHKTSFDVFLSHSIKDSDIVLGAKRIIEKTGKTVYVDWIVDPQLDRDKVNGDTAEKLRIRMKQCKSLMYLYSRNSQSSRWMPWELGFFDGYNGNVAILPVYPDGGTLDFAKEEYLQLYPTVDFDTAKQTGAPTLFVNKNSTVYKSLNEWMASADKLRPTG